MLDQNIKCIGNAIKCFEFLQVFRLHHSKRSLLPLKASIKLNIARLPSQSKKKAESLIRLKRNANESA